MTEQTFTKPLTANDTGESGGHQAGIHVPKSQTELIAFLPLLDGSIKNPDAWLTCTDADGHPWSFRYIFYNNKHHDPKGTRDEYRITHMTKYFRATGAQEGDIFEISGQTGSAQYRIQVIPSGDTQTEPGPIRLTGWRRVH